jgi:hypothetical protein
MAAAAAGVRSALVVDLGWTETTVTSLYEYREVRCTRSVRGGRLLLEEVHDLVRKTVMQDRSEDVGEGEGDRIISFDECEDIVCRLVWCRRATNGLGELSGEGLPTVQEQDESDLPSRPATGRGDTVSIPLRTSHPRLEPQLPFEKLADVCEKTFLDLQCGASSFDDHEIPIHLLLYQHLLQLPVDVRGACMSRIIFTGGCTNIPGLKGRIFDEVSELVHTRGWDPVQGKVVQQLRSSLKLRRSGRKDADGPASIATQVEDTEQDGVWHDAANAVPETDPVEEQVKKGWERRKYVHGVLRCIESLGSWTGASMVCQLKVPAMSTIDRDAWLLQGENGASRPGDVDVRAQQRQSLGPGGLLRAVGGSGQANWTLGAWGYV